MRYLTLREDGSNSSTDLQQPRNGKPRTQIQACQAPVARRWAKHRVITCQPLHSQVPTWQKWKHAHTKTCVALFVTAKREKQPKRPSADKWINKMVYLSTIKRNAVLTHTSTLMSLENTMLELPWWPSGEDPTLPKQRVWVRSLVWELRSHVPCSTANKLIN